MGPSTPRCLSQSCAVSCLFSDSSVGIDCRNYKVVALGVMFVWSVGPLSFGPFSCFVCSCVSGFPKGGRGASSQRPLCLGRLASGGQTDGWI